MSDRAIKRAAIVTGCGLAVELAAAIHWTPMMFIASAALGAPLVLIGAAMFLRAVWRIMKEKGAA
jgi:hypothetical protein